jgi:hypothetical protein
MHNLLQQGFDGLCLDQPDKNLLPAPLQNVLYCDISRDSVVKTRSFRGGPSLICFGRRGPESLRLGDCPEFSLRQFP